MVLLVVGTVATSLTSPLPSPAQPQKLKLKVKITIDCRCLSTSPSFLMLSTSFMCVSQLERRLP